MGILPNISYREYILTENDDRERTIVLSFMPTVYAAYNLHKNVYVGTNFGYEILYSNYYRRRSFVEVGVLARYWVPYTINHRFFRKLRMYIQASYEWTSFKKMPETMNTFNYKTLEIYEDFIVRKGLSFNKYAFPVGLTFRLKRYMYAEMNWQYLKFVNGKGMTGFMAGIGFNVGQNNCDAKKKPKPGEF